MATISADLLVPDPTLRSAPSLAAGIHRGIARRCPACGVGPLFGGYLSVRPKCPACGNDNDSYPSDDFAPYVTIFVVLHLLMPVLIVVDRLWAPPLWLEVAAAGPFFAAATLLVLPFAKGAVIGFAWAYGVTRERGPGE